VDEVDVRAVELHDARDHLPRERPAVHDELQAEIADHLAGAARRRRAHVAEPPVERDERFAQPVADLDVGASGRAAKRVTLDLVDAQPAAKALGDVLDELGEDLARVLVLGAGNETRYSRRYRPSPRAHRWTPRR
jgi:hypothetical protein